MIRNSAAWIQFYCACSCSLNTNADNRVVRNYLIIQLSWRVRKQRCPYVKQLPLSAEAANCYVHRPVVLWTDVRNYNLSAQWLSSPRPRFV